MRPRLTVYQAIINSIFSVNAKYIFTVPPNIANVSSDGVVCEGSMVTLSCNATGKPSPSITWTRAFNNGTDSAPLLPVVGGKHVISNITRGSNGTYRCTADNGVDDPVNRTVTVTVRCKYLSSMYNLIFVLNNLSKFIKKIIFFVFAQFNYACIRYNMTASYNVYVKIHLHVDECSPFVLNK